MAKYKFQPPKEDSSIVPFGKYKGQPTEIMLADHDYMEWVTSQPGIMKMLETRYQAIFNIIMVGAPKTDDTPEHNKLQALFLNREFQYAFIELVLGKSVYAIAKEAAQKADRASLDALDEALN